MSLLNAQLILDIRENSYKKELCKEIKNYFKLKKAWRLGPIQVKIEQCLLRCCQRDTIEGTDMYMIIAGFYTDHNNVQRREFLGYSYDRALCRLHFVKSFINLREIFNLVPEPLE